MDTNLPGYYFDDGQVNITLPKGRLFIDHLLIFIVIEVILASLFNWLETLSVQYRENGPLNQDNIQLPLVQLNKIDLAFAC